MPNDCWNHITLTADAPTLDALMGNEFREIPELKILQRGVEGVVLRTWSRWQPDFDWLERLITQYPSCWLKNEWKEEGGNAGVWIGTMRSGTKVIRRMEWEDMCLEELSDKFRTQ